MNSLVRSFVLLFTVCALAVEAAAEDETKIVVPKEFHNQVQEKLREELNLFDSTIRDAAKGIADSPQDASLSTKILNMDRLIEGRNRVADAIQNGFGIRFKGAQSSGDADGGRLLNTCIIVTRKKDWAVLSVPCKIYDIVQH